jgi:hypothetical protein
MRSADRSEWRAAQMADQIATVSKQRLKSRRLPYLATMFTQSNAPSSLACRQHERIPVYPGNRRDAHTETHRFQPLVLAIAGRCSGGKRHLLRNLSIPSATWAAPALPDRLGVGGRLLDLRDLLFPDTHDSVKCIRGSGAPVRARAGCDFSPVASRDIVPDIQASAEESDRRMSTPPPASTTPETAGRTEASREECGRGEVRESTACYCEKRDARLQGIINRPPATSMVPPSEIQPGTVPVCFPRKSPTTGRISAHSRTFVRRMI